MLYNKCHVMLYNMQGRIQNFFLGGGALVSCSTSTPITHIVFFFAEYQLYQNTAGHLMWEGVHPLHPPPRSAPDMCHVMLYNMCHVMLYNIKYLMLYNICHVMLNNICHLMLYNKCHVMLYNKCHVMLYNMCHVMLHNNMLCYITCHVML